MMGFTDGVLPIVFRLQVTVTADVDTSVVRTKNTLAADALAPLDSNVRWCLEAYTASARSTSGLCGVSWSATPSISGRIPNDPPI